MSDEQTTTETKRDRVRRLLIEPLQAHGMRFPKAMPEAEKRRALDSIADQVAYMSDRGLTVLAECLRTKGEGSAKDFWPSLASITTYAHSFEPRPLNERPELLRWFASRAGPDALQAGRHVAEYLWWQKKGHPPLTDRDKALVREKSREMADKALRVQERIDRSLPPLHDDGAWLDWYRALDQRVRGYIAAGEKAA
ncbi:hypothetical protein [Salipiger mucosus]|uniref:Uncharacterized protein n=1 Tax=Salipiger mucosus DSM 16094 TaxID=1123237 RepID=S9RVT1_9RHOB|nr:hypothetical protein [Salipiger mucosus]EPX82085.1 hypothetical protein Salmuc_02452 [Salipiger mucosus DSM 16094]